MGIITVGNRFANPENAPKVGRMNSFHSSSPVYQSLFLRVATAIRKQPIPERRASWRMRWVERFANFIRQPESPESIAGCRERFLAEIASTQSASPWLLQEIDEATGLLVQLAEPAELSALLQRPVLLTRTTARPLPPPLERSPRPAKLIDQIRAVIRARHYSRRTEDAYIHWARQ